MTKRPTIYASDHASQLEKISWLKEFYGDKQYFLTMLEVELGPHVYLEDKQEYPGLTKDEMVSLNEMWNSITFDFDFNKYKMKSLLSHPPIGMTTDMFRTIPPIVCNDGFSMSVQASNSHYSIPRENVPNYTHVEVGYPTAEEKILMPYAEDTETPTATVYGYVPIEIISILVKKHGGLKK